MIAAWLTPDTLIPATHSKNKHLPVTCSKLSSFIANIQNEAIDLGPSYVSRGRRTAVTAISKDGDREQIRRRHKNTRTVVKGVRTTFPGALILLVEGIRILGSKIKPLSKN
jgi:hypothetical protein